VELAVPTGDPVTGKLGKEQKKHYSSFELNNATLELVSHPSPSSLSATFSCLFFGALVRGLHLIVSGTLCCRTPC
jgi:hypothetical protein